MQEYKEPPCRVTRENRLGSGGNGIVGYVPYSQPEAVIKVFSVDRKLSITKRDERYQRFCKEIEIQRRLGSEIEGILPVYDAGFPEAFSKEKQAWYTMPKAREFNLRDKVSLEEKLQRMLWLAGIIKELHIRNMAHRDIKPENLLIYKGKIHLADYGLVWIDGEESITQSDERMGPIKIMPPELEEREEIVACDYRKSDVYLFAKVMWMYLKENSHGFRGTYNRGEPQMYLDRKQFGACTLEPLHQMMENATKHEWSKRPAIDDCIEWIRQELSILMGDFSEEKEQKYIVSEKMRFYRANVKPDSLIYENSESIYTFLRDMIPQLEIRLNIRERRISLKPRLVRDRGQNLFLFTQEQPDGRVQRYAVRIQRLEIGDTGIKVYTGRLDRQEMGRGVLENAELLDGEYIGEIILG